jgi:ribosome-associated protein
MTVSHLTAQQSLALILASLEEDKAVDVISLDLADKTTIADFMVVASGRSQRQVTAMAQHLEIKLKAAGCAWLEVEGERYGDWVVVDAGDVIVHLFRPEVRQFYSLEKIWAVSQEAEAGAHQAILS